MNLYFELLKKPVFTVADVNLYYNNMDSARSAIKRLMKEDLVSKIRSNLYTCISGETGAPVANRFQIASNITSSSYVSHHTAMEYLGITNQIYYDVYVSSETSFRDFDYDGYTYRYVHSKFKDGVESPSLSGGVRITNIERTLVDCIKNMNKIAGFEEILQNIESIKHINENRILEYLSIYSNQFLYKNVGFFLCLYKDKMNLSDNFFDKCKLNVGNSKRYLALDYANGQYDKDWNLIIPNSIVSIFKEGLNDEAI